MKRLTTEEFIERARRIHGNKYDYSKVVYINARTKVCIICPIHGEFWQTPDLHLQGHGCSLCSGKIQLSEDEFIRRANLVHNNKYDYSKVNYINYHTKICIICPIHGEFWQEPANHLCGKGCRKCSRNSYNYNTDEWILLAKQVHGNKYDYSKVSYKNSSTKVCIICPKHGEFLQEPNNHLIGQGCPKCKESKLEYNTRKILEDNKIEYEYQKKFEWLGNQRLDFYLPKHKIAIECQGGQHYKPVDFGGKGEEWAKKLFEKTKKLDRIKLNKVKENNIRMLYINEDNKNNFLNKIL
jgi:very-short-patch-repair endonuclease